MSGNLSEELVQILNSNQVVAFLNAANNFIELLETDGLTGKKYYEKTHLALLALYVAGINLPDVDLIYSDNDKFLYQMQEYKK